MIMIMFNNSVSLHYYYDDYYGDRVSQNVKFAFDKIACHTFLFRLAIIYYLCDFYKDDDVV